MSIQDNFSFFRSQLPATVDLLAISKTQSVEVIREAYSTGQRAFGENKAQEMLSKYPLLPKDIEWHFVGHLQTNKVKIILPVVHLIHSVDSEKLLQVINVESQKINKITDCLLQFYIASEETKYGFDFPESVSLMESTWFQQMNHIRLRGVMGMATFTEDKQQVRMEFRNLKNIFNALKYKYFQQQDSFNIVSMGMSDDYPLAIEEGSTLIRIGTALFGERKYPAI